MILVTVKYTEDFEMIEAHCMADEIKENTTYEVKVINPKGKEEI